MEIQAEFKFQGMSYLFKRSLRLLDRNYEDEGYAYFLEPIPNTEQGLFEINLLKEDLALQEKGYTAIYYSSEQVIPDKVICTAIKFL